MTTMPSTGVTPIERFLADLCSRSFLRLWSYANPHKDDGHEFCDVLAVFEKHVFIFFDRDKQLADLTQEEDPQTGSQSPEFFFGVDVYSTQCV